MTAAEELKREEKWEMAKKAIIVGVNVGDVMSFSGLTKQDMDAIEKEIKEEMRK